MSIRQAEGGIYHVDITIPGGTRVRHSTGTSDKKAAQEYHDTLRAKLWRITNLDETPSITFDEAALRWLQEKAHKASLANDVTAISYFKRIWSGVTLDRIGRDEIAKAVESIQCKDSTRNRYVSFIRGMLNKAAKEWGVLDQVPPIKTYKESKRRIRWITYSEASVLIQSLPKHYGQITRFALATGLRMSNILELEWSQVDMQRKVAWIHADQAKARRAITVPLSSEAIAVIRERIGLSQTRVFGKLKRIESRPWKRALDQSGIKDFRFHDLRHTWASWHVQRGTPLHVLQELGGWECVEMVQKYAHLSADHLSQYVLDVSFEESDHVKFESSGFDEDKGGRCARAA